MAHVRAVTVCLAAVALAAPAAAEDCHLLSVVEEDPLFGLSWDVRLGAGDNLSTRSGTYDFNGGRLIALWPETPITIEGDLDVDGRRAVAHLNGFAYDLGQQSVLAETSAAVVFDVGLSLTAWSEGVVQRDDQGDIVAQETAGFDVAARTGVYPDYPDWAPCGGSGTTPGGATVRFHAAGGDLRPGQPIVLTAYGSEESWSGTSDGVSGEMEHGTMLDLRPNLVLGEGFLPVEGRVGASLHDTRPEYGGTSGTHVFLGQSTVIGPYQGNPFPAHNGALGQLGYAGGQQVYRDRVGLGAWLDMDLAAPPSTGYHEACDLDLDLNVGVQAVAAEPTWWNVAGYADAGRPDPAGVRVKEFTQILPDTCGETASAMLVDYYVRSSGQAHDRSQSDIQSELNGYLPFFHPCKFGPLTPGAAAHCVNEYLKARNIPLASRLLFRATTEVGSHIEEMLEYLVEPAILGLQDPAGGAGHAVLVDGYARYTVGNEVAEFISVKDTWGASPGDLAGGYVLYTPGWYHGAWTDASDLAWWPLLEDSDGVYLGSMNYYYSEMLVVAPRDEEPRLSLDTFDNATEGAYAAYEGPSLAWLAWPGGVGLQDGEAEDLALHVSSADGEGGIWTSTPLAETLYVGFEYVLTGGEPVELAIDGIPVASLAPDADGGLFTAVLDVVALGLDPTAIGELTFDFAPGGPRELWLNDWIVLNQPLAAGDADLDLDVDAVDLAMLGLAWNPEPAAINGWFSGDFDADGDVDAVDLAALGFAWNPEGYGRTPLAVPEPTALALVVTGGLARLARRRPARTG